MREQNKVEWLKELRSALHLWQTGLIAAGLLWAAGLALLLLPVFALIDRLFFVTEQARMMCLIFWWSASIGIVGFITVRMLRLKARDMAARADRSGQHVMAALDLTAQPINSNMEAWLAEQEIGKGRQQLAKMPRSEILPLPEIKRGARLPAAAISLIILLSLIWSTPLWTATGRLFHPSADIPPYSPYSFALTPDHPEMLYGGQLDLKIQISGREIDQKVELVSMLESGEQATICYQEGDGLYGLQLDRITEEQTFFIRVGRARSKRKQIDLLLQPQIETCEINVAPPAYSKRPERTFIAGSEALEALKNTQLRMTVSSNRPLSSGVLTLLTENHSKELDGIRSGLNSLTFDWTLEQSATLQLIVRDVRGTPCAETLELSQKILPDEAPDVRLLSPGTEVLATPSTIVPMAVASSDDIGLQSVQLLMALDSFRDRSRTLPCEAAPASLKWEKPLKLANLGVKPGQIIECYAEAQDTNPEMPAVSASTIGSIKIISEGEYAEHLRMQMTIEAFLARFDMAVDAMEKSRKALDELEKSLETPEEREAKREQLMKQLKAADELYKMLAEDFALYDEERDLAKTVAEARKRIAAAQKAMQQLSSQSQTAQWQKEIDAAQKALGEMAEQMQQQAQNAEEVAAIQRVMEQSVKFQEIYLAQKELVRRIERYRSGPNAHNKRALQPYGKREEELKQALQELLKNLRQRAEELPESESKLRASAQAFADMLEEMKITDALTNASTSAVKGDGPAAADYASDALKLMEQMLSSCSGNGQCFGQMCALKFNVPNPTQTLQDMFKALCQGRGLGQDQGKGGGQGSGPYGTKGGWAHGQSSPMYGPQRLNFTGSGNAGVKASEGRGGNRRSAYNETGSDAISTKRSAKAQGHGESSGQVPQQYRKAIERYFSSPTETIHE